LKLTQIVLCYPHIGELAETGVDAVNHLIAVNNFLDQLTRGGNARTGRGRDCDILAIDSDSSDLLQRERVTVELHSRSLVEKNPLGRGLDKSRPSQRKKGQVETRPGLLGEMAHNKFPDTGFISRWSCPRVAGRPPCVARKPQVPMP